MERYIITFGGERGGVYADTLEDAEAKARELAVRGQAMVDGSGTQYPSTVRYAVRHADTRMTISIWPPYPENV